MMESQFMIDKPGQTITGYVPRVTRFDYGIHGWVEVTNFLLDGWLGTSDWYKITFNQRKEIFKIAKKRGLLQR